MRNFLSEEDVLRIAKLAALRLYPEELPLFQRQLSETINYFEVLTKVETEIKLLPMTFQVSGLFNALREDTIDDSRLLSQKEALSGSRENYKGYFVVPGIFEEG